MIAIKVDRTEIIKPSQRTIGLDVGLESFYSDSDFNMDLETIFLANNADQIGKTELVLL